MDFAKFLGNIVAKNMVRILEKGIGLPRKKTVNLNYFQIRREYCIDTESEQRQVT